MKTDEKSLYTEALKALVRDKGFYPYQNELLLDSSTYWDKMPPSLVDDKPIVFVNSHNEKTLLSGNHNAIEILNFESPKIDGDELVIKINHTLSVTIYSQDDENSWSKRLTDKDKNLIKDLINRGKEINGIKESKTFNSAINNKWTYVKFKFNNQDKRFKIIGLEIKSM